MRRVSFSPAARAKVWFEEEFSSPVVWGKGGSMYNVFLSLSQMKRKEVEKVGGAAQHSCGWGSLAALDTPRFRFARCWICHTRSMPSRTYSSSLRVCCCCFGNGRADQRQKSRWASDGKHIRIFSNKLGGEVSKYSRRSEGFFLEPDGNRNEITCKLLIMHFEYISQYLFAI